MKQSVRLSGRDAEELALIFKRLSSSDKNVQKLTQFSLKLANISSVTVIDRSEPRLHMVSLSIFPSLQEIFLDSVPPSLVTDLHSFGRLQLRQIEIINAGIPELSKFLCPNGISSLSPSHTHTFTHTDTRTHTLTLCVYMCVCLLPISITPFI